MRATTITFEDIISIATLTKNLPNNTSEFFKMTSALNNLKTGFSGSNVELVKLGKSITALSEAQKIAQVSGLQLNSTQKALILQSAGLSVEQSKQALTTKAVDNAQKAATASAITFGGVLKGLGVFLKSNWVGLAITGIVLAVQAFDHFNRKQQETIDKAKELSDTFNETYKTISDNISMIQGLDSEFEKLSKGVGDYGENISLSADEYRRYQEIVQQILGISPHLITGYDNEGKALANKNSLIEESIKLLKEENRQKLENQISDKSLDTLRKGYVSEYKKELDSLNQTASNSLFQQGFFSDDFANLYSKALNLDKNFWGGGGKDFIKWNTDDIVSNIDEIIKYAEEQGSYLSDIQLEALKKIQMDYVREFNQLDKISQKLNPTLQLVPQTLTAYDEMSDAQKNFITQYINGFRVMADTTPEQVQKMKDDILDLVESLGNNNEAKEAVNNLFALDISKLNASDYEKQVKDLFAKIQSALNLTDEQVVSITAKLGFDIDKVENLKAAIANSLGIDENDPKYQIIVELATNLKTDELANMQRYIAEATDTTEAEKRLESLSKIFTPDNEKFLQNVRSVQSEFDKGKLTYSEYAAELEKLSGKLKDPDAIETFIEIFGRITPAVQSSTNTIVFEFERISEAYDKLTSAMAKAEKGEVFSMKEVMENVKSGYLKLSDVNFIDMTIPVEVFKKGLDEMDNDWRIFVGKEKDKLEEGLSEAEIAFQIALDENNQPEIERLKIEIQNINDEIIGVTNIPLELKIPIIIDLIKTLSELKSVYSALDAAQKDMNTQGFISTETISKLASVTDNYLDYLYLENGVLQLNIEAWKELAEERSNSEISKIRDEISLLEDQKSTLQQSIGGYDDWVNTRAELEEINRQLREKIKLLEQAEAINTSVQSEQDNTRIKEIAESSIKDIQYDRDRGIKTEEEYYNALESIINNFYKNNKVFLDDYNKYEIEITNGRKKLFNESYEKDKNELDYLLSAKKISQKEYYNSLNELNEKYYANDKNNTEKYLKNRLEVINGLQKVEEAHLKERLAIAEKNDDYSEQIEIYKELQRLQEITADSLLAEGFSKDDVELLEIYNKLLEYLEKIKDINDKSSSNLSNNIKEISSAYSTVKDAIKEYENAGALSAETLISLVNLGNEYLQYLFDEKGNLILNEKAFRNLAIAKLEDLKATKLQELQSLVDSLKEQGETVEELKESWIKAAAAKHIYASPIDLGEFGDLPQVQEFVNLLNLIDETIENISNGESFITSSDDPYKVEIEATKLLEARLQKVNELLSQNDKLIKANDSNQNVQADLIRERIKLLNEEQNLVIQIKSKNQEKISNKVQELAEYGIKIKYEPELDTLDFEQTADEIQDILNNINVGDFDKNNELKKTLESLLTDVINLGSENDKNNSQILELIAAIIEFKKQAESLEISTDFSKTLEDLTEKTSLLSSAYAEQSRNGQISRETYEALYSSGEDYKNLLDETSDGYILLAEKAKDFTNDLVNQVIQQAIVNGFSEEQIDQLRQLYITYNTLSDNMSDVQKASSLFVTAQKEIKDSGELSVDTLHQLMAVSSGFTKYLDYSSGKLKVNIDAWNQEEGAVALALKMLQEYNHSLPQVSERTEGQIAILRYLYEIYDRLRNGVKSTIEVFEELNDRIDNLQSAYSTIKSAQEEYKDLNYLTIDTVQSLLSLGDEYLQYLDVSDGKIRLNSEALDAKVESLKAEMIASTQAALAEEIRGIIEDDLTDKTDDLANSTDTARQRLIDIGTQALNTAGDMTTLAGTVAAVNAAFDGEIDASGISEEAMKKISEAIDNAQTRLDIISRIGNNESLDKSGSKSSNDAHKEAFENELKELQYDRDKGLITESEYYDKLEVLNNNYFKDIEKYLDDYRKYELEILNGREKLYNDSYDKEKADLDYLLKAKLISQKEYYKQLGELNDKYYADNEKYSDKYRSTKLESAQGLQKIEESRINEEIGLAEKSGNYDRQIALYKELQDNLHTLAEEYRQSDLEDVDTEILELQNKWQDYYKKIKDLKFASAFYEFDKANNHTSQLLDELDRKLSDLSENDVDTKFELITEKMHLQEEEAARIIIQYNVLRQLFDDGTIDVTKFDEEIAKLNKTLYDNNRQIQENKTALANLKFDIDISKSTSAIEQINFQLQRLSDTDYDKKIEAINKQIEIENRIIDANYQKLQNLNSLMSQGAMSAAQYEQRIKEVTKAWQDGILAADRYGKEVLNIQLAQAQAQKDALNAIVDLTKNLIKQEVADDVKKINDAIKDIEKSKKALNDLEKDLNKNLKDRKKLDDDNKKALNDQLKAAKKIADQRKKDLQDEIKLQKELTKEAMKRLDDELDAYKAIIDAKKKALEMESDDRYYEQDLTEKQKEIADVQDRISELRFNDSSDASKEKLELAEKLAKKQLELDNFIYDHSKQKQLDALDSEWERYSKLKQDEKDAIDANLEAYEKSIDAQIDAIERQNEAMQEAHDARIEAIDAELEAYENMINLQIEGLQREGEAFDLQIENKREQIQDIQDRIANNGELTRQAMARIDQEGDALYQKLVEWNKIYGTGIEEDIKGAWQEYLDLIDRGNMSTLDQTRSILEEILRLNREIASYQSQISQSDYSSGLIGIRDYFEDMGNIVNWDENSKRFTISNSNGTTSFDSSGYLNEDGHLKATLEQIQDILKHLPKYNKGGYIEEDQVALIHKGERVLTKKQTEEYDAAPLVRYEKITEIPGFKGINPEAFSKILSMDSAYSKVMNPFENIGNTLKNITANINGVPSLIIEKIENNFDGITSEQFARDQENFGNRIVDKAFNKVKTVMNKESRARGTVGSFNPLG